MYKIILVEDEPLARQAIIKAVPFEDLGFQVVAICENGEDAWKEYQALSPDLVITDICMPLLSGLELASLISEQPNPAKIIILTGYDDFNYAQKAISYNVTDYILKPITKEDLSNVLIKTKLILDQTKEQSLQYHLAKSQLYAATPLLREQLFNRFLQGSIDFSSFAEEFNELKIQQGQNYYQLLVFKVKNLNKVITDHQVTIELVQFMLTNIMGELASDFAKAFAFGLLNGSVALLFSHPSRPQLESISTVLKNRILQQTFDTIGIDLFVYETQIVSPLSQIQKAYQELQQALELSLPLDNPANVLPNSLQQTKENLILQIKLQNQAQVEEIIKQYISSHSLGNQLTNLGIKDLNLLLKEVQSALQTDLNFNLELNLASTFWTENSAEKVQNCLIFKLRETIELLKSSRHGTVSRLSVMATEYIKANYQNCDLSLLEVCDYLSVSMSYFSIFFKAQTNKTFIEYLTEIRMEKAKELLFQTDFMLYTVASQVGYENPAYFTVAFKKYTGLNPKEYRKLKAITPSL